MKKFLSIAFAVFGLLLVSVIIPSCYMDWEQFVPDDHNPSEKPKEPQTNESPDSNDISENPGSKKPETVPPGTAVPVPLKNGFEMTFQFENNTKGKFSDDRIYICVIGLNSSNQFCYLTPSGELVRIEANQQSDAWSFKLNKLGAGFQIPKTMASGRLYISMDNPVVMRGVVDAGGRIGVVQPDLNNPSDANANLIFDWIEFTVQWGGFWGNTTQVDQFCFPITMAMYNDDGYYRTVGITKTRDQIFAAFKKEMPQKFGTLVHEPYRIVAPCKGDFRNGKKYSSYMKSYVDQVWDYYKSHTEVVKHPLGNFKLSAEGDKLMFTCTEGYGTATVGQRYYIQAKPTSDELFEGSGVLATGNLVELALQAQVCAALNRHVAETPSNWAKPETYYKAEPCNMYAKFWHEHSIEGFAYGYCYDDVADQSTLIETHSPRALVIGIGY